MIIFLLLGMLIVSVLWELCYRHLWSKDVVVKLRFESGAVYAGQDTKLYEVIENRKRIPVPVLEVGFHTRKELDFADTENTNVSDYIYKRDVFAILGRQKITREIPVKCTKRGKYILSNAEITTYTLLYRKYYSRIVEISEELYVYPKMTDVSEIVTICEHMLGTLQCAKKLYEDPLAFRNIRNYTTSDPMKTINWKASAKTGSLMVNTYDSVQSQKAMVFLDVEDTTILKREYLVEESISIAATIIRKLLKQNIEAGFAYNGSWSSDRQLIMPTNNKSALTGLERMLAEYDDKNMKNGIEDFGRLVNRLFADIFSKKPLPQDTLLIFITKNLKTQLMESIRNCVGEYQTLIVMPIFRGEKNFQDNSSIKNKDNVHIVVREVDRG